MKENRLIRISAAGSRFATRWPTQEIWLSEFYQKLSVPARSSETRAAYLAMKKRDQDERKDVGGFVGGILKDGVRKAGNVLGRDIITLDIDRVAAGGTDDILRRLANLGCGWAAYSTRKHGPEAPRLRAIIPVDRTLAPDEYEPAARKIAQLIDQTMEIFDPTTFQAVRLMYWPSCSSDAEFIFQGEDKPMLSGDGVLGMYTSWQDTAQWPQVPGANEELHRSAEKAEDPTTKQGVVGAFCRVYDIYSAMDTFLPGVYEPVDSANDRYTFIGGSTSGGAVIYQNGIFLYSHHATDPAGGRLCNAFDLVRLHKFGDLDDAPDVKPGTPPARLPSYAAMKELAAADTAVKAQFGADLAQQMLVDFGPPAAGLAGGDQVVTGIPAAAAPQALPLTFNSNGALEKTIDNLWVLMDNDPLLVGKFALNEFTNRAEVFGVLPWNGCTERRQWEDNDNFGLYWYFEKAYGITGNGKIDGALSLHAQQHSFNEVVDYLKSLEWDGVARLDTLFIDYLGAEDNEYTRAVTRKAFTAAVARAMQPGTKFDTMTVLSGPQGIGKSTLLRLMGKSWFTDSLRDFSNLKETSELIQGAWILEISELGAMRHMEINKVKQVLSQQVDRFRAAYARNVKDCPRRCVFFGSSNDREYLQDKTGNRRFWPVDVGVIPPIKNVFTDLPAKVDQVWAEAVLRWSLNEPLYLTGAAAKFSMFVQEEHREQSVNEGIIRDFLDQQIPSDWDKWDLTRRQAFWNGGAADVDDLDLVDRDRVCALEVWCEALGQDRRFIKNRDSAEINSIIAATPRWRRLPKPARFGYCKVQRGFERV